MFSSICPVRESREAVPAPDGGAHSWMGVRGQVEDYVAKPPELPIHLLEFLRGRHLYDIHPGIHPNFDFTKFEVTQQRALRRLAQMTHLTRDGEVRMGQSTTYRYALIRPANQMRGLLHSEREVMVVFSDYAEFQSRTLDAFDRILSESSDEFRIEKVARILISEDPNVARKVKKLFESKPDAPVVIPFHISELSLASKSTDIAARIREFTYSRDLFSMSSPLRGDLYFYGRSNLINEICSKLASGENFGLFGLRRSGKTSLVNGINRALRTRAGAGVVIDCQSPAVHQRRWYELLEHIAQSAKSSLNSNVKLAKSEKYSEKDASETFLRDMRAIKKNIKSEFVALLFDEVERISFGTASSEHWNTGRDFLHFWQAIRYGFQSPDSPFSFLIVGTNPSSVERIKIFESDNPLFGNVEKRFIPMFSPTQVTEMVDDLGSIMGVQFDDQCKSKLHSDFGGHPFLTRYACSYICQSATERPLEVDRTVYAEGIEKFATESHTYVDSIVGLLRDEYPDEYEMLSYLGVGDHQSFCAFADSDPNLYEHLVGYGIVREGRRSYYFRIGSVESYFEKKAKPTKLLDQKGRLAEISERRNSLEKSLRSLIKNVHTIQVKRGDRRNRVVSKLHPARREALDDFSFEDLCSEGQSPLYFDEIRHIIAGNWASFENAIDLSKSDFEYHMSTVNSSRSDAHAKHVSDDIFDKWRVSISELASNLG